jgi:acetate kinase
MPASAAMLVFNAGSSSLKFTLYDGLQSRRLKLTLRGTVRNIGGISSLDWSDGNTNTSIFIEASNHESAAEWVLDWLHSLWPFGSLLTNVGLVAHRIVHGGLNFSLPTVITERVMLQLEALGQLAPLHNPQAMMVILAAKKKLKSQALAVAVFDSAFFHDLPAYAGYALSESLTRKHGIRRLGFHGLAHRSMMQQYLSMGSDNSANPNIISFQLGHGCSVAAIQNRKPIDTSMGFTPLEGLVMATRGGDIDPGILLYLLKNGHQLAELEQKLNYHSGLLGIAKSSAEMSELLARQEFDDDAKLAVAMFCHRARKYLGAYMAILNGADVILFGGGIGEHCAEIRWRICADMAWCGLELDQQRNSQVSTSGSGTALLISADSSKICVYVIPVNEEIIIAGEAMAAFAN